MVGLTPRGSGIADQPGFPILVKELVKHASGGENAQPAKTEKENQP